MSVDIPLRSRLQFADLLSYSGVEFWETVDLPNVEIQSDDVFHIVCSTDRIDSIAYKYYGDPVLWWVVAVANDLELVPTDLYEGQTLRIPAPRYVLQELFTSVAKGR
jgi:nucleoid-associated protein YgaU